VYEATKDDLSLGT